MSRNWRLVAAVACALCLPVGAAAQQYRFDLGVFGGGSWFTSALDREDLGGTDGEVQFDAGWLTGAQAGFWFSPRVGLRANFGYTDRPLTLDTNESLDADGEAELLPNVNLWTGTGDLLLRFAGTPRDEFMGAEFLPYLAFGLGARWVNAAGEGTTLADGEAGGDADHGVAFMVNDEAFFMQDRAGLMGRVALGSDLRLSPGLALRFEVGDMISNVPFERLTLSNGDFVRTDDGDVGGAQHEFYGTAGMHVLFGQKRAEIVAAMPAPPPPPAAEPAPPPPPVQPEPEPVEESVSVCVIDPGTGTTATRTVTAFYRPAQGDTLVDDAGRRIPIRDFVSNVRVATTEDWYVTGRPLSVQYGTARFDYTPYGMGRFMDNLVVLGTVNGVTIYAEESAAEALRTAAGAELRRDGDLQVFLTDRSDLRDEFETIDMLYVVSDPIGCEFAPLQRMEDVRKNRSN